MVGMAVPSPTPDNLEDCLRCREYSGLAIIVTNDYQNTVGYDTLYGTVKDGDQMKAAFLRMNFFFKCYRNVNRSAFQSIVREISCLSLDIVKDYSCIAILFAGHGIQNDALVLQDGSLFKLSEIIRQLLPSKCPRLGDIPKVYLIDACRGQSITNTVPVPALHGRGSSDGTSETRGGKLLNEIDMPSEGNFLIARSTLPKCKAYESGERGGVWFHTLAEYMQKIDQTMSLDDILTEVNEHMILKQEKPVQQPEKFSRLNRIVYLKPDCRNFLATPIHQESHQECVGSTKPSTSFCSLLDGYLAREHMTARYQVKPCVLNTPQWYYGIVTLHVQQKQEIFKEYKTSEPYPTPKKAREEVAKIAYSSITSDPPQLTHGDPECGAISGSGAMQAPPTLSAKLPSNYYYTQFLKYCQDKGIKHRFEFEDNESGSVNLFKCAVSFMRNGKTVRAKSKNYYLLKDEAIEVACHNILDLVL